MIGDCDWCGHSIMYHLPMVGCIKCGCDEFGCHAEHEAQPPAPTPPEASEK